MRLPIHKEILAQALYSLHSFMTTTLTQIQVISALTAIYIRRIEFICKADNRFVNVRLECMDCRKSWQANSILGQLTGHQ